MPEIRKDIMRDSWVVTATDKALHPQNFTINKKCIQIEALPEVCPFCEGNEALTPPEIEAVREGNTLPDTPGWTIRTIPNKFSVFSLQGVLMKKQAGFYHSYSNVGKHEVIVETPSHDQEMHQFDADRMEQILLTLKRRYNHLLEDERIKYIQVYKNRGLFAGASQDHSHTQILAFPMVPTQNRGLIAYYSQDSSCYLCDLLREEQRLESRVIAGEEHFLLICPYASRFPYETWIIPRSHHQHFGDISREEIKSLSLLLPRLLRVMLTYLEDPAYNLVIHTAPANMVNLPAYHWFIEISPRLLVMNGVEAASGYCLNPVAPETAAVVFRSLYHAGADSG